MRSFFEKPAKSNLITSNTKRFVYAMRRLSTVAWTKKSKTQSCCFVNNKFKLANIRKLLQNRGLLHNSLLVNEETDKVLVQKQGLELNVTAEYCIDYRVQLYCIERVQLVSL